MTLRQKLTLTGFALFNLALFAGVSAEPVEARFGVCGVDHECNCITGTGGVKFCGRSAGNCTTDEECNLI